MTTLIPAMHLDPHPQDWVAATLITIMAWRLPWSRLKVVELVFVAETFALLLWHTWPLWAALDKLINLPLETAAICFCRRYPTAQCGLIIHILLKIYLYADIDCDWQFPLGPLPHIIYWQNFCIILVLLAYTFRKGEHYGKPADNQP